MILENISTMLQKGKAVEVKKLVQEALDQGVTPKEILNNGLIFGMSIIGRKFKNNEVFVPEVLIAARAMNAGMDVVKPALLADGVEPIGKAIICTVKGDLHDIGKNLVKMMFEGQGIECIDLGVDVHEDRVVDAIRENKPDIVCLSALLTTTMFSQKEVVEAITKAGLRDQVMIMIGGAPVTQEYADQIGADAYSPDAASAADYAKNYLLKGEKNV
ncbi:MAG: cobalamin-binding protein [Acholeplasmataceae bacterium]|jgi:5-methyltetrahydrofolate--homocysteine methyltransferase|nr:cobalamin-binding protein [Acholeplasmataceae bacterium]